MDSALLNRIGFPQPLARRSPWLGPDQDHGPGRWVRTIPAEDGWDLNNDAGQKVASGLYLYLGTDGLGRRARGVLAVIR
ncbi:MAG: hypothetical protein HY549_04370 [Elusimicrobia bacterium]|nr:hypothetical protein [Elusimicrobiota bacterium]